MSLSRFMILAIFIIAQAMAALSGAAAPPEKLALTGGNIITVSGEEIENGTILIERGRITAVGADVELPYDAMEVDCAGKVIMPGMIDPHSWRGLDVPNEPLDVGPMLNVYDAIDPSRLYFEDALRDGVTSIHMIQANNTVIGGLSRVIHPIGLTPDEMTLVPDVALKMSVSPKSGFDRMRQRAMLRETFLELDDYLGQLAEAQYEAHLEEEGETIDVGPEEARERGREFVDDQDYDDKHYNLVRLRRGDIDAWIYCGNAMDVGPAIDMAREQGFLDNTTLVVDGESYKAIDEIQDSGCPVVLPESLTYRERDPITGEIDEHFLPRLYHDEQIMFALQPNPGGSMAERYLNYQAARCVREGIPRQDAFRAITLNPAKMLGVDELVGSIEPGKIANLVVMSGDPFDFNSWVDEVYINGILAYTREKDPRLERLLDLEEQRARQKAQADAAEAEAQDGEAEGEGDADDAGEGEGDGEAADTDADQRGDGGSDEGDSTGGDNGEGDNGDGGAH